MTGKNRNLEKCFEDSQESGILNISRRNMKEFPHSVDIYDLTDVVNADISNNKFTEIPGELISSFMMECLNCSYNCIRSILDMSQLTSLTNLNLSHNQIQVLPVHMCSLPLKNFIISHNKLEIIPSEIGLLGKLQHFDVSNNELSGIPSSFGELISLRTLNVRRNKLLALPDEISKLKFLMKLDISCNRIASLPPAFRLITSLVKLDSKDNPLTSPPTQVCLKGRLHIFKYLSMAAQQQDKPFSLDKESRKNNRRSPSISSISSNSLMEHDYRLNHIDQMRGSQELLDVTEKRHCDHSIEEQEVIEKNLTQKAAGLKTGKNLPTSQFDVSDQDFEFLQKEDAYPLIEEEPVILLEAGKSEKRTPRDNDVLLVNNCQEKLRQQLSPKQKNVALSRNLEKKSIQADQNTMSLDRASIRKYGSKIKSYGEIEPHNEKSEAFDINERKEQLLKMRKEALITKQKLEKIKSPPEKDQIVFEGIGKRSSLGRGKTAKALKEGHSTFTMRRIFDSAKEEFQQLEKLRQAVESRLDTKLPDDLPAALADGVVLCHLVNHVRKSTIQVIHVPSGGMIYYHIHELSLVYALVRCLTMSSQRSFKVPRLKKKQNATGDLPNFQWDDVSMKEAVGHGSFGSVISAIYNPTTDPQQRPKLTMPKCLMNVDAFLEGCRKLGVEKAQLCSPGDILEEKNPNQVCNTVHALLQATSFTNL